MKKLIAMLLTAALIAALAVCGFGSAAAEAEPVTLRIAYMPNFAALWAVATADAKGYFAEEGITVEMVPFEDGPTEIAAMESGNIDLSYIGPGAHRLCSTGNAVIVMLQHMGDADCIIGLKGITTLEELKGKTVGYAAGTSSETILLAALDSVGMTIDDVNAMSMDSTALTTAALSGSVDAVAAWSPFSLTILAQAADATDICSNVDFASLVSPASWVANPTWAAENGDTIVRFLRAMYKAMDYAACLTTDDEVANEVAGYIADVISSDAETVISQRYDGAWMTSAEMLALIDSGTMIEYYTNQQANFIAAGKLDPEGLVAPADFVLTDLMVEAGK